MNQEKLIQALNQDLADELSAITQYMWHHVMAEGMESAAVADLFKKTSVDEMKHAEALAEKIDYLGGTPITKPSEIKMGGDLTKMIQDDLAAELKAIKNYKEHIKLCEEDPVTRRMLEEILEDEEGHENEWRTLLSKRK
jgi:bacterioferritin